METMEKVVGDTTEEWFEWKCVFCKQDLRDSSPKLLPCCHSSCSSCVFGETSSTNDANPLRCPVCRQEFRVKDVIDNYFVKEFSKSEEGHPEDDERVVPCTNCEDNATATSYCIECGEWLCDACVQAHLRVRITKDHTIQSKNTAECHLKSSSGSVPVLFCPIHKQEQVKLYCESCDQLTCRDCQLHFHNSHKYQYVNEAYTVQKQQLHILSKKLQERKNNLQLVCNELKQLHSGFSVKENQIREEIKMFAMKYISEIGQRSRQLVKDLHNICEGKRNTLKASTTELNTAVTNMEHCLKFVKTALDRGNETAVLYSKRTLFNQLNALYGLRFQNPPAQRDLDLSFTYDQTCAGQIRQIGHLKIGNHCLNSDKNAAPQTIHQHNSLQGGSTQGMHPSTAHPTNNSTSVVSANPAEASASALKVNANAARCQPPDGYVVSRPQTPYCDPNGIRPEFYASQVLNALPSQFRNPVTSTQRVSSTTPLHAVQQNNQPYNPLDASMQYHRHHNARLLNLLESSKSVGHAQPTPETTIYNSPGINTIPIQSYQPPNAVIHSNAVPAQGYLAQNNSMPSNGPTFPQPPPYIRPILPKQVPNGMPIPTTLVQQREVPNIIKQQQQQQRSLLIHQQHKQRPLPVQQQPQQRPSQMHQQRPTLIRQQVPQQQPQSAIMPQHQRQQFLQQQQFYKHYATESGGSVQCMPPNQCTINNAMVGSGTQRLRHYPQTNITITTVANTPQSRPLSLVLSSSSASRGLSQTSAAIVPAISISAVGGPAGVNTTITTRTIQDSTIPNASNFQDRVEKVSSTQLPISNNGNASIKTENQHSTQDCSVGFTSKSLPEICQESLDNILKSLSTDHRKEAETIARLNELTSNIGEGEKQTEKQKPDSSSSPGIGNRSPWQQNCINIDKLIENAVGSPDVMLASPPAKPTPDIVTIDDDEEEDNQIIPKIVETRTLSGTSNDPNEDWCSVCHDGGDLLCCGKCPRVYHLECHVPPQPSVPKVEDNWQCLMCTNVNDIQENQGIDGKRKAELGLCDKELKLCQRILLEVLCHEASPPFHEPVNVSSAPEYNNIIQNPMDLETVKSKLALDYFDHYSSVDEFLYEMYLVFHNCCTYNEKESELYTAGKKLTEFLDELVKKFLPEYANMPFEERKNLWHSNVKRRKGDEVRKHIC